MLRASGAIVQTTAYIDSTYTLVLVLAASSCSKGSLFSYSIFIEVLLRGTRIVKAALSARTVVRAWQMACARC